VADPVRIPLGRGLFALIDAADSERVAAFAWHATTKKEHPDVHYVQHTTRLGSGQSARKGSLALHRFIMGCQPGDGKVVDHRNGNPLDNRRENLRVTDKRGNATNVTRSKQQRRGGFKGVSWNPAMGKWQASICAGEVKPNGKRRQLYLGCFVDPIDAALAYDAVALQHFGEFACLNFATREEAELRRQREAAAVKGAA